MSRPPPGLQSPGVKEQRKILGALLVDRGVVEPRHVEEALEVQAGTGEPLGQILLHMGVATEEELFRALAFQLSLPFIPPPLIPKPEALARVRPAFARSKRVLPLDWNGRHLEVVMANPLDLETLDDLQFQCGGRVVPAVSPPSAIVEALETAFQPGEGEGASLRADGSTGEGAHAEDGSEADRTAGVRGALDRLLERAAGNGASDLHLEPGPDGVRARERIDGILRPVPGAARISPSALLSRIKVMARMDIAVKLRPQDGGFTLRHEGHTLAVRVSTLPVEHGEKAVLRILNPDEAPSSLDELGLAGRDLTRVRRLIGAGSGVLLTAGPTGSGKTSTLAAAVAELDRDGLNVVTLEDPVEYRMAGVSQVQVHPRAGLTFPAALRAVLRQDPDVVLVGEIRDRETAEIAMSAAVTGHLVLSTIHTIDAPSGITRLLHIGVPPHLVAGGLAGIVSQRLIRRVCGACGGRGGACSSCPDGYRGRTGIFQVLTMTETIRDEVVRGASTSVFRRRARAAGMGSMAEDARRKVAEGITSPHEVARVLRQDPAEALPCAGCGAGVPPEALGCPHCGRTIQLRCACGQRLRREWRFCPSCLRPALNPG
jgi:type IV pilus assembly protein PilB